MGEAVGHCVDAVEEGEGLGGAGVIDGADGGVELDRGPGLFGRSVGYAEMLEAISAGTAGTFRKIERDARRGAAGLVGEGSVGGGNFVDELLDEACGLDGEIVGDELAGVRGRVGLGIHGAPPGSWVHAPFLASPHGLSRVATGPTHRQWR